MIGSFTALLIVLGFVLPGYITGSIVGRRVYLRPIGDFELLFQSVLLSTFYFVLWTLATAISWIHVLSPVYIISQMDKTPPTLGWNALASLGVLLLLSVFVGRWSWLVEWVTTYGRRLHPYPIWYNLFGATPLTTKRSPWVWVEMDSGKVITGRVIDFGLDDPDAGSLVLVMVTVIVGDTDEKRPGDERWYIPEKSIHSLSVEYVMPTPNANEETEKT